VNASRFTWIALFVGLGLMGTMFILKNIGPKDPTANATTTASAAATSPAKPATSATGASAPSAPGATTTAPASAPAISSAPARPSSEVTWENPRHPYQEAYLGSLTKGGDYRMQVQVVGNGAAVKTIKLADYFATVEDKRRCEKDPATYDQALAADKSGKLQGHFCIIRLVGLDDNLTYPLSTYKIYFPAENVSLILSDLLNYGGKSMTNWQVGPVVADQAGTQSVTLSSLIRRDGSDFVLLEKTYSLPKNSYSLNVALKVVNLTDGPVEFRLAQFGPMGVTRDDVQTDRRKVDYAELLKAKGEVKVGKVDYAALPNTAQGYARSKPAGSPSDALNPALWVGVGNKFFSSILYAVPNAAGTLDAPEDAAQFFWGSLQETPVAGLGGQNFLTGVNLGYSDKSTDISSSPGGKNLTADPMPPELRKKAVERFMNPPASASQPAENLDLPGHLVNLNLFAGPKLPELFDDARLALPNGATDVPLYAQLNYHGSIDLGSCCGFCGTAWLSMKMIWLLNKFYLVTHNYGVAIMILVVLVRLALHPLTKKGQVSMSKMQKLQPQMAKIKEQYKADKAKLNEEMMKLYKTGGGSPFLGFLPMLLQMPIWIALWSGLTAAVQLRHAAFLPFWITDLAAPDALVRFGGQPYWIPLLSQFGMGPVSSFNLLPILFGVSMILQQKFMPGATGMAGGTGAPADAQAKTQRQMMYFMNIFFLVLFYNAPSGLTLYMMTSNFAALGEQYFIRKHIRQREEDEAAGAVKVEVPGGHFRGQKPKKPKGPFRF
jgi:YidC/Oxa1 family membrane protein insertase